MLNRAAGIEPQKEMIERAPEQILERTLEQEIEREAPERVIGWAMEL